MRFLAVATLAALAAAGPFDFAQGQSLAVAEDKQTFRSGVDVTGITVTVRDADGHLVTDLDRGDFDIYEDGERQELTQFTRERVPVSLGVLLDISDSMF